MDIVSERLERGEEMIAPGMSDDIVDKWYAEFGSLYNTLSGGR